MSGIIVIQTDFGIGGGSAMRGTCKKVDAALDIYEINHQVEKFNVREASRFLYHEAAYWPQGTVFVSVIDPGVGTSRRASIARLANGSYVVSPDNGTLTYLLQRPGIVAIRQIDEKVNRLKGTEDVSIFHGRDLFAYCGARLAAGVIDYAGVGPEYPVSEIITFAEPGWQMSEKGFLGEATGTMKAFGNIETSIPIAKVREKGFVNGDLLKVTISSDDRIIYAGLVPYRTSFGYVGVGEEVIYNSSDGVLGIGINRDSFVERYGIVTVDGLKIRVEKE